MTNTQLDEAVQRLRRCTKDQLSFNDLDTVLAALDDARNSMKNAYDELMDAQPHIAILGKLGGFLDVHIEIAMNTLKSAMKGRP